MLSTLPKLQHLSFTQTDWEEDVPILDFSELSFPHLETLSFKAAKLKTIKFIGVNYPRLKLLEFDNLVSRDIDNFVLSYLPCLEEISIQFLTIVDSSRFAASLSSCLSLKSFNSYKLWGLGALNIPQRLILPECRHLTFYRSDDLAGLILYAPKLESLDIQACYSFRRLKVLNNRPKGYAYLPKPSELTPFDLNVVNIFVSPKLEDDIQSCTRIKSVKREDEEDRPTSDNQSPWDDLYNNLPSLQPGMRTDLSTLMERMIKFMGQTERKRTHSESTTTSLD